MVKKLITFEKCIKLGRHHQIRVEIRAGALHCWPEMNKQWAIWGGHFTEKAFNYINNGMSQWEENFEKHVPLLHTFLKLSSPCFYPIPLNDKDQDLIKSMLKDYPDTERFRW